MSGKRVKAYSRSFSSVLACYQQLGVVYLSLLGHSISHTLGCRVFEHDLCLLCGNQILVKLEAQSQHSSITTLFPFCPKPVCLTKSIPGVSLSRTVPSLFSHPGQSVCVASVGCFQLCGCRANLDPCAVQRLKDLGGHQVP